ncbi:hypothetical protein AALO_G00091480 [Alosa alosa]|uniref:Uncharacterized protein n=1 Tax=Alosa alosa TaxID=278164 RepID=A0AAV6GXU9_9TELE|nr:uncharacterized protein LOC125297401 isoform X1 [Alosa alosa]XP_048103723.1 uncharacterized protein LOC125297401 isoform X1 [Alosa alosa]KAG5277796.1 hypothetical protein AALO_G00091480 [Alosa alosa]
MDHGLSYSSGGNVTDTQDDLLRVIVKEEDIKEEDYGHMTAFQHDEEKPFVEPHCKTETDIIEKDVEDVSTCTETQQTTAEVKVKKEEEEEELDYVLGAPVTNAPPPKRQRSSQGMMSNLYCPVPLPLPSNAFAESLHRNLSQIGSKSHMFKLLEENRKRPAALVSTDFGDLPKGSVLSYHATQSSSANDGPMFPAQPCSFYTVLDDTESGYYGGLDDTESVAAGDSDKGTET